MHQALGITRGSARQGRCLNNRTEISPPKDNHEGTKDTKKHEEVQKRMDDDSDAKISIGRDENWHARNTMKAFLRDPSCPSWLRGEIFSCMKLEHSHPSGRVPIDAPYRLWPDAQMQSASAFIR